jgi:hypothetical protein
MKTLGYIIIAAFFAMSIPMYSDICNDKSGLKCPDEATKTSKNITGNDDCLCIFHHVQFSGEARIQTSLELKFLSIEFNLSQDMIHSSFAASVLLEPPSVA